MKFKELKVIAEIRNEDGRNIDTTVDVIVLAGQHNPNSVLRELHRNHPNCTIIIKDVQWIVNIEN